MQHICCFGCLLVFPKETISKPGVWAIEATLSLLKLYRTHVNYLDANGNQTNSRSSKHIIKNDLNQEYFTLFRSGAENEKHGKTQPIGRRFTSDIVFNEIYVNPMPCTITERIRREGEILVY